MVASVSLSCAPAVSLKGDWNVVSAYGLGTAEELPLPYISFQDSGRVSGSTGVNLFSGGYKAKGQSLSFENIGMTRRGAAVGMDVENAIKKAFDSAFSYQAKGEELIIRDEDGKEVMILKKK